MPGAEFVRADLHVHTLADEKDAAVCPIEDFLTAAWESDVAVLGITDHHRADRARAAVAAAEGTGLLVLPGVEISTNEGHLLALFAPDAVETLEVFVTELQLTADPLDGSKRSKRSMVDLVGAIDQRGGLAIPAHVDRPNGFLARIGQPALVSLLASPQLAALEFTRVDAMREWFSETDEDQKRSAAWRARGKVPELRRRGLARIMSSDAHAPHVVGQDRANRILTRLRLDDLNFLAVRNALLLSPRSRCKAEQVLPPSYPRVVRARFTGGFLDGVELDFSANLTCVIGGRGSGKSTALLATRAALGAVPDSSEGESPDDPDRMPTRTEVDFVDAVGAERTAVRERYGAPYEAGSGAPISLTLQGLAQDESGRLAREYESNPLSILGFLEQFVDLSAHKATEAGLRALLDDNAAEVKRTHVSEKDVSEAEKRVKQLEASLDAAQKSRVDQIAEWATWLAATSPLLDRLRAAIVAAQAPIPQRRIDLKRFAQETSADLAHPRARKFTDGPTGLQALLDSLHRERDLAGEAWSERVRAAAQAALDVLGSWEADREQLQRRLDAKRKELEEQGLSVQANAVTKLAAGLERRRKELIALQERRRAHVEALAARRNLLNDLNRDRERRFQTRKHALSRVEGEANAAAYGLRIHLRHEHAAVRGEWEDWLGSTFRFRSPRTERVARAISPARMAEVLLDDARKLADVEAGGERFFNEEAVVEGRRLAADWDTIFWLQTLRIEDQVQIAVQEVGRPEPRPFDHLSQGQQRSVLLSLMLCADRHDPLVLDQPEDHLDAPYIASALVGHLEAAKERRQVILATHSPNLTVLGDAELVVPMYAEAGHGAPRDMGAVDRPATRVHVCTLLEGGEDAFRRRGERYGFRLAP